MSAFDPKALEALAAAYPEAPVALSHNLLDDGRLTLSELAALAERMDPSTVEYNAGRLPIGIDPAAVPGNGLSIAETIAGIEKNGSWMVLKFIERDPEYRALLHETLAEVGPVARAATGEMIKLEGFVFISSPGSVTPFHFDPEHNILMQVAGTKRITIFPAGDEEIASSVQHETFHQGGHRNLVWDDAFAEKGCAFEMGPGDAVHVPVKAPHWVQNGPEPSISLSVTWRSRWSHSEADARGLNHLLRLAGFAPEPPGRFPHRNLAKSIAYRAIRKVRRQG